MFKANNKDIRKTPDHWRRSGLYTVNFEHISLCSAASIVDFQHVIAEWVKVVPLR